MKCYLFHDAVLSDVDLDFSTAYYESLSGDEGDWAREKFRSKPNLRKIFDENTKICRLLSSNLKYH